jgi:hypothetical protein
MATWEQILKKNAFVTTWTYCSNEAEAEPDYRGIGIVENTTHYVKGGLPTISRTYASAIRRVINGNRQ